MNSLDMAMLAKRLLANAAIYAIERQRIITRWRIGYASMATLLGHPRLIPDAVLTELNTELSKLGWFCFQNGMEFCIMDLRVITTWVKLSNKRIDPLLDVQIDALWKEDPFRGNHTPTAQSPQEE